MVTRTSPARLAARLDGEPSRWLWLVKWFLLVPHLIVLFFLWLAFPAVTLVAMVAILFTGRYPRPLFDFTLGVMRWSWRVWCYGYGALATDRYPPFSLDAEPDYPATLDIAYPETLSRGLALVKWWLLAIPHYLVISFFTGGGWFFGYAGGLVTLLSLFAGVALLFTGHYPRGIFDLVIGMDRWVLRVAAYAALMTDEYPPFRLDPGGDDPTPAAPESAVPAAGWSPARTAGVIVGVLVLIIGAVGATGGGGLLWLEGERDSAGYVVIPAQQYRDGGYALRFDAADLAPVARDWVGEVRIQVSGVDSQPIFAGIARTADVARYLDGVPHRRFHDYRDYQHMAVTGSTMATRPPNMPGGLDIWVDSASSTGTLTLDWTPRPGDWSLVIMKTGAQPDVRVEVTFAATAPALKPVAITALPTGIVLLVGGALLIALAARPRRIGNGGKK